MAIGHAAARLDQALHGDGQLLERLVPGGGGDAQGGAGADHPALQLGDFGERPFDRVLDGADLGGDLESGGFDHLFAHDVLLPLARGHPAPGHGQQCARMGERLSR